MIHSEAYVIIQCPIDAVWEFIAVDFFRNYPRWSPEVKELQTLDSGPLRVGFMARQVRVDQGHRSESTFKIADFQLQKRLCFEGVSNPYRVIYEFECLHPATRLLFRFELLKLELFMMPFEKLIHFALQDGVQRVVRSLKNLVEAEALRQNRV